MEYCSGCFQRGKRVKDEMLNVVYLYASNKCRRLIEKRDKKKKKKYLDITTANIPPIIHQLKLVYIQTIKVFIVSPI